MLSGRMIRWCGVAATLGGALFVGNSSAMLAGRGGFDVIPFAMPLFALGLVGLHAILPEGAGSLRQSGGMLAYTALAAAAGALVAGGFVALDALGGVEAVPDIVWPIHVILFMAVVLTTLVGGLLLGLAAVRTRAAARGYTLPFVVLAALWVPLLLIGEGIGNALSPDHEIGLGFMLSGLAWVGLGYVVWSWTPERDAPAAISGPAATAEAIA